VLLLCSLPKKRSSLLLLIGRCLTWFVWYDWLLPTAVVKLERDIVQRDGLEGGLKADPANVTAADYNCEYPYKE
jgi:hypothetical protein